MLAASTAAWAGHSSPPALPVIDACLNSGGAGPVLDHARALAAHILLQADIRLLWHTDLHTCLAAPRALVITLSLDTPGLDHPGALAYALPFSRTRAVLFYDRITRAADPPLVPYLLAFALAHEITHLLQGIDRHSPTGIMKAHWDSRDYADMLRGSFRFAPEDVQLIRLGANR